MGVTSQSPVPSAPTLRQGDLRSPPSTAHDVEIHGTVIPCVPDPRSRRSGGTSNPSSLPSDILSRMSEVSRMVIRHIGYRDGAFNIECLWDPAEHTAWLLETNPRISKSRAPLFQLVDGCSHHQVMVDLGPGRRPRFPAARRRLRMAASSSRRGRLCVRRDGRGARRFARRGGRRHRRRSRAARSRGCAAIAGPGCSTGWAPGDARGAG